MENQGMISLKDFISDTLVQIVEGVMHAQQETEGKKGVMINPRVPVGERLNADGLVYDSSNDRGASLVHFDVAVTVSKEKSASAGGKAEIKGFIGVVAGSVGLGAEGKTDTAKSEESRIRFVIPISLPVPAKNRPAA